MPGSYIQDPNANPALAALRSQQLQKQTQQNTRQAQDQLTQDEFTRNQLSAQGMALDQSRMMQGTPAPRVVTDTSMTIGPGGEYSESSSSRSASGGGGSSGTRQLPPDIQGRFMPLVQLGSQSNIGASSQPRESMPAADFSPGDATAHQDAAFARMKDRAGQMGRGAVDSLAAELAGRGISGASGSFGRGLADRVSRSVQPLADLNVAHLGEEYNASQRARELSEGRASNEFSGNISQRGQDASTQQALNALRASLLEAQYSGEIQQRGQDLQSIYRGY